MDPKLASYGVENPIYAVIQLAQTTMRSELGKITLDKTFEERDTLNEKIVVLMLRSPPSMLLIVFLTCSRILVVFVCGGITFAFRNTYFLLLVVVILYCILP